MDPTNLSPLAKLLVCAAVAFVVTDIATTTLRVRYVFGRWAVTRWLLRGLHWHREPAWTDEFMFVVLGILMPWRLLQHGMHWMASARADRSAVVKNDEMIEREHKAIDVEAALVALTCRDRSALYRMPPDVIAAQINAAATTVLDGPREHLVLLFALAGQQVDKALETAVDASQKDRGPFVVSESASLSDTLLAYGRIATFREALTTNESYKTQLLEMRARIETAIQQRIDAFQSSARAAAQLRDQAMYLLVAVAAVRVVDAEFGLAWSRYGVTTAIIAAFLAPYFGDLRAFLRQPR